MAVQMVLTMETESPSLRSKAVAWGCEDPSNYVHGRPIGMTPGPSFWHSYGTVLQALAEGWRLLAPPEPLNGGATWDWWFVKDAAQ